MNRTMRWLLLIIVGAVLLRLGFLLLAGHTLSLQASGYDDYTVNLLAGNGYTRVAGVNPDSDLPPLIPFFLAGVYSVFGRGAIPVALIQIGFDVVTLVTVFALGRRIGGERVGLLAAAFTGFYPYLVFQNLSVNDTALFIMLLSLSVWGVYRSAERQSWRWALFSGLMIGLAALTKSLVLLMLPPFALWWWRQTDLRRAGLFSAALVVACALPVVPWIVRNTQAHATLTFISTNDGSNLYQGNNPCAADYLFNGWDVQWVDCLNPTPPGLSAVEASAWFRDQALSWMRDNPGEIPRLLLAKFTTLWSPELLPRSVPPTAILDNQVVLQYEMPLFQAARTIHLLYFGILLLLALIGLWRAFRLRQVTGIYAPILIVIAGITLAYLIYHPSTRYRAPADPFVFILSASATVWLWDRLQLRRKQTAASSSSMIA